jgi:hypothetical protein
VLVLDTGESAREVGRYITFDGLRRLVLKDKLLVQSARIPWELGHDR